MDVGPVRELLRRPSRRSVGLTVAAVLVMAVVLSWSIRQSRLTHEALSRAAAAERAAVQARSDAQRRPPLDTSIRRSAHDDPREIARVRQLQDEIEGLGQLRDQLEESTRIDRLYVPKELRNRR
jgi:type II secretory pathway pseudopilin PulG